MSVEWNRWLKLPEGALAGNKRVPKTQIIAQAHLTSAQQSLLDKLAPVALFASLTRSNSYIPAVRDEDYDIGSVLFLACSLNSSRGAAEAARMLHGCFPNPTVLLLEAHERNVVAISAALRRKSLSEHGAFVTERVTGSGAFDCTDEACRPFLDAIALPHLPQTSLLDYVRGLGRCCQLAASVRTLGFYPSCRPADADALSEAVAELQVSQRELAELQEQRKVKGTTLAESTKLRVRMRDVQKEIDSQIAGIEKLCGSRQ